MDSDRKSTVSSFYGGRKSSMDALNNDFPSPTHNHSNSQSNQFRSPGAGRADDASSFFNPAAVGGAGVGAGDRPGMGHRNNPSSAGYNRNSFFFAGREEPLKGGRDEEEDGFGASPGLGGYGAGPGGYGGAGGAGDGGAGGFDIYADFNNAGPKYSSAYTSSNGYQALSGGQQTNGSSTTLPKDSTPNTPGTQVELVTVPALGPEWRKEEMRNMKKSTKRERKYESRREAWKAWNRGERGMCGKYFTRRVFVIFMFGLCIVIGIILAIVIPRVPAFSLNSDNPLANATGDWASAVPIHFERLPANFTFPAFADMRIDTGNNYLPLHFTHLFGQVFDSETGKQVAKGDLGSLTIGTKKIENVMLPLNFTYTATNFTDPTWINWHDACQNAGVVQGGIRPGLNFRFVLEMNIAGLIGKRIASTQVTNAACPVELPLNAG